MGNNNTIVPELINIPVNIGSAGSLQNAYVVGGGYDEDGLLQGKLMDLRLYNSALSLTDIDYIYKNQISQVSVDPILRFPFTESTREYISSGIFFQ